MEEQKNVILAIVLAVVILFGWEFLVGGIMPPPPPPQETVQQDGQAVTPPSQSGAPQPSVAGAPQSSTAPTVPGIVSQAEKAIEIEKNRKEVLKSVDRVKIQSPRIHGSIALKGARIDDVTFADYRETLDPESNEIAIFSPIGGPNPYFAQFGWSGAAGIKVPTGETLWKATSEVLTPEKPLVMTWDNGEGLIFTRTFAIDDKYMFTVDQSVVNKTDKPVALYPYGLLSRTSTPETSGFIILHEGPLGVFNQTLEEVDYDDLQDAGTIKQESIGGWIGITDKYWLAALIPNQQAKNSSRFNYVLDNRADKYQVDYLGEGVTIAPGATGINTSHFFAGAKEMKMIDTYTETLKIDRFDLAIDFGWLYFLTKPIFVALLWLNGYIGNLGVAILVLTVFIKLLLFPLANKSYKSMARMKKMQPKMIQLRERFGDDKARLNQEMMAFYKKEKVNPAAGCLPMLIQIPVFFALYKVLFVNIEMRHAPFFGWIQDLSAPDPTSLFNLFGLIPWTPPDFLMIGVWPLIMGASMWLQQRLNPQPADPIQARVMMMLPFVFTFLLGTFPSGLVIYWAWNNILSIIQQKMIMRQEGVT
ncbi:MAG: membrane protein insertase YidC [Rhodospirillales bacterium]|nr:membrane protein insertase YidC [Rhodospirillales bacterium]